jgi:tRNA(Ile)-lysidine synthase
MTSRVAVAVSGGRDSMALLHCLSRAAKAAKVQVLALHVHHGLMPQADDWSAFVARTCQRWARRGAPIEFQMQRLHGAPAPGQSVEAWARAGRYASLAAMARESGCRVVALAHHRGDQAETFLLQALRGAGAAGLAAMPAAVERDGVRWVRPWLEQPREAIEAYAHAHRIKWVDDASNADARFARSRLRVAVMPALTAAFADAEPALARAAQNAAHARAFIDEVARADLSTAQGDGGTLLTERWLALSAARRRECLRAWLTERAPLGASDALLERLLNEVPAARSPARWPAPGGGEVRRYRGVLSWAPAGQASARAAAWPCVAHLNRLGDHPVPGCDATLRVERAAAGAGLPLALLAGAQWRGRIGADRFQRVLRSPPRDLKRQFQGAGVAAWSRDAPLLIAADGRLIFVPGLGADARALAEAGQPRVILAWVGGR